MQVFQNADSQRVSSSASLFDDNFGAEVAVEGATRVDGVVGLDSKNVRCHNATPEIVDRILHDTRAAIRSIKYGVQRTRKVS